MRLHNHLKMLINTMIEEEVSISIQMYGIWETEWQQDCLQRQTK